MRSGDRTMRSASVRECTWTLGARRCGRAGFACPVAIASTTAACRVLLDPRLDELRYECIGEGLVGAEADRSLHRVVGLQLLPVILDDLHAHGEEAAVVLERGVGHEQSTMVLERRHLVADRFLS